MKKKIFILSYPNGLPGVPMDVANYKAYFKSDCGGAWTNDEIVEISGLCARETEELLKSEASVLDFMYVIYLGHGTAVYTGSVPDRGFCFSNTDILTLNQIKNATSTTRCIVIADTCCGIPTYAGGGRIIGPLVESHTPFSSQCRDYLESAISSCDKPNFAALFSTSLGEFALDFTVGGCYSVYLLNDAKNAGPFIGDPSIPHATVREVHKYAALNTSMYASRLKPPHRQTPVYEDGELLDIPFYIDAAKIGAINE